MYQPALFVKNGHFTAGRCREGVWGRGVVWQGEDSGTPSGACFGYGREQLISSEAVRVEKMETMLKLMSFQL